MFTHNNASCVDGNYCFLNGINLPPVGFYYVVVSTGDLQLDSFEEPAMLPFDHLYNFAHWCTQNREEAEDLVQEPTLRH